MTSESKILVLGGGFSGIAQAILLAKLGFKDVTLLEKNKEFKTFGGPIVLAGTGRFVVERIIGAKDITDPLCSKYINNIRINSAKDLSLLKEFSVDWPGEELDSVSISRDHLLKTLLEVLYTTTVKIRLGQAIESLVENNEKVSVVIGGEKETYDFLIDASGYNSRLREAALGFKDFREDRLIWLVECDPEVKENSIVTHLSFGFSSICFDNTDQVGSLFVTKIERTKHEEIIAQNLEEKKQILVNLLRKFEVDKLFIDYTNKAKNIYCKSDQEIVLRHSFCKKIAFIGDADHGLSPYTGMGTSLAMEDGIALVDSLSLARDKNESAEMAFQVYEKLRRERIKSVRLSSRILTKPIFSLPSFFNVLIPIVNHLLIRKKKLKIFTKTLYADQKMIDYLREFKTRTNL